MASEGTTGGTTMARLDEQGDMNAPSGSRAWAAWVRWELNGAIRDEKYSAERIERLLATMNGSKGYQQLTDRNGHPFPTLESFCREKRPYGLGYDKAILDALISERRTTHALANDSQLRVLRSHGEIGRGRGNDGRLNRGSDRTSIPH
jgi:hypothetical protein